MKRSWIGLGLLVGMLVISIAVTWGMTTIHKDTAADLRQAGECAILGDWQNAGAFLEKAEKHWTKWEHFRASFADHTPVEEIDAAFAELTVYRITQENTAFAAACAETARKIEAVGEAHALVWWNFF